MERKEKEKKQKHNDHISPSFKNQQSSSPSSAASPRNEVVEGQSRSSPDPEAPRVPLRPGSPIPIPGSPPELGEPALTSCKVQRKIKVQRPVQHPMVPECAGAGSGIGTAGTGRAGTGTAGTGTAGTEHPAHRSPGALPASSTERSCRSPPPGARRAGREEGGGTEVAAAAGAPPGVGEEAVGPRLKRATFCRTFPSRRLRRLG